ncbi:MAG: hypothetical protein E7254_12355 [Lachnospiraceae bacterium]|nr:hypothetical protein [Lachnospiraceae bacterium]
MKRDQFAGRYFIKIISSIIIALCNMGVQFMLPRALDVGEYGLYTYNLNVFTSVVVMANLSTSSALVAKYSKRCEDIGYVQFYLFFYAVVSFVLTVGVMLLFRIESIRNSFGGQSLILVLLGLEAALITKLMSDVISIYDAAAISRFPSIIHIILRIVLCAFVASTFIMGRLNLRMFYLGQISIILAVVVFLVFEFFKDYKQNYPVYEKRPIKEYAIEYYQFCKPLVFAGIISQGIIILMNYTLLKHAGTTEQAMFGAAWQLNTLVCYIFSPYAELMKREFAVLVNQKELLERRLWQSIKTIVWIVTYFAIFIAVFAQWLLPLLFGENYKGAILVTQMIMIYTIFQAWGQLCGSYMIATESTKGYAVLSVIGQAVSVVCVFLFQVPNFIFEDGLGSFGIGLTYMCTNYISVVVMMIYLTKGVKNAHIRMHGIYLLAIISCVVFALFTRLCFGSLIMHQGRLVPLLGIILSGMIYSLLVGIELYLIPNLVGIQRETIKRYARKIIMKWKR